MPSAIPPPLQQPHPSTLLQPLLSALPTGSLPHPPPDLLPHLSPILRQRIKLLSSPSQPWLPLLTSPSSPSETGASLLHLSRSDTFDPHPVSGEVEVDVDWQDGREVVLRYRRVDEETMWASIGIEKLGLWTKCVYCVGDGEGPADGWRIAEVGVLRSGAQEVGGGGGDGGSDETGEWLETLDAAERSFIAAKTNANGLAVPTAAVWGENATADDDYDDAAYWAQYDATPAATPAPENRSPAPPNMRHGQEQLQTQSQAQAPRNGSAVAAAEDAYFAQYAAVQPALDAHDPDEAGANGDVESSLGVQHEREFVGSSRATGAGWVGGGMDGGAREENGERDYEREHEERFGRERNAELEQPRPHSASSSASGRSAAVEVLEERVEREEAEEREGRHEIAIRQHIGASVKSLYRLARAGGMGRAEFRAVVQRELAVVGVEEDEDGDGEE